MVFTPNYHWNYVKFNFGMIPVAIWYEYHTSLFAEYLKPNVNKWWFSTSILKANLHVNHTGKKRTLNCPWHWISQQKTESWANLMSPGKKHMRYLTGVLLQRTPTDASHVLTYSWWPWMQLKLTCLTWSTTKHGTITWYHISRKFDLAIQRIYTFGELNLMIA